MWCGVNFQRQTRLYRPLEPPGNNGDSSTAALRLVHKVSVLSLGSKVLGKGGQGGQRGKGSKKTQLRNDRNKLGRPFPILDSHMSALQIQYHSSRRVHSRN